MKIETEDDLTSPFGILKQALEGSGVTAVFLEEEKAIVLKKYYSRKDPDDMCVSTWFDLPTLEKWWRRSEITEQVNKLLREMNAEIIRAKNAS